MPIGRLIGIAGHACSFEKNGGCANFKQLLAPCSGMYPGFLRLSTHEACNSLQRVGFFGET